MAENKKSYTKNDWEAIKRDWLNGVRPMDLIRKYNTHKSQTYSMIRKWLNEGLVPDDYDEESKLKVDDKNFIEMWDKLESFELTEKQKVFTITYCMTDDKLEAIKRAQYNCTDASAHVMAYKLLKNEKIKAAIKELKPQITSKYDVNSDDVVGYMAKLFNANMGDYIDDFGTRRVTVTTRKGTYEKEVPYIQLKDKKDVDMSLVKGIKVGQSGDLQIELHDKNKAVDFFIKYLGLLENSEGNTNENKLAQGLMLLAQSFSKTNNE
ncbi:MAG: terminase small subunit [Paraclostridium sp.]